MNILPLICQIFAFVCFFLGAVGVPEPHQWRLVPAGLAFYMLSLFVLSLG